MKEGVSAGQLQPIRDLQAASAQELILYFIYELVSLFTLLFLP